MSTHRNHQSLLEKVSGPNAVSIETLVERGEIASARIQEKFDDFLKLRVIALEKMLDDLQGEAAPEAWWRIFYTIIHDIRGSAALAGNMSVSTFCISLERLLQERDPLDPRMRTAILSHINALNLVVSQGAPDNASQELLVAELSRAVSCLPLKARSLKAG